MKLARLLMTEAIIAPKEKTTKLFIRKWSHGDMSAIDHLSDEVISDLHATVQDESYTLYRGWKFEDSSEMIAKLGIRKQLEVGDTFVLSTEKIRSWSKSKSVAEQFANPKFDSINGREHSDHEIEGMGYSHGDLLGITVVLKTTAPDSKIMADLENLPPGLMSHGHDELEVIVHAGKFNVEVISFDVHTHTSPNHIDKNNLNKLMVNVVSDYNITPDTFENIAEKFEHLPNNEEAAFLLLVFGFDNEDILTHVDELHTNYSNNLSDEQYKLIRNYIREYHNSGEDPYDLRTEWRHFKKIVNKFHDEIDWDNLDWEAE